MQLYNLFTLKEPSLPLVVAPALAAGQVWFDQPMSNCRFVNNSGVALTIQSGSIGQSSNLTLGAYPQWADATVYGLGTMRITNCSFQGGNTSCMESIKYNILNRHPSLPTKYNYSTLPVSLGGPVWPVVVDAVSITNSYASTGPAVVLTGTARVFMQNSVMARNKGIYCMA